MTPSAASPTSDRAADTSRKFFASVTMLFRFGNHAVSKFQIAVTELGEEDERYFFRAHADLADGGIGGIKPGRVFL
jgi:hypothetical protein